MELFEVEVVAASLAVGVSSLRSERKPRLASPSVSKLRLIGVWAGAAVVVVAGLDDAPLMMVAVLVGLEPNRELRLAAACCSLKRSRSKAFGCGEQLVRGVRQRAAVRLKRG